MVTPQVAEPLIDSIDGAGDTGLEGLEGLEEDLSTPPEPAVTEPAEPAAAEPVEPAPAIDPAEFTRIQEENARLTRQAEEHRRAAEEAQIQQVAQQEIQTRASRYVAAGYDEDQALRISQLEVAERLSAWRANQAELQRTATELHYQYGVPLEQLRSFRDPVAMRAHAEQYANTIGPQAQYIKQLEARLARLEKSQVPAQSYDRPGGAAGVTITADNIDQLYLQGKVSDERYRRFLENGA